MIHRTLAGLLLLVTAATSSHRLLAQETDQPVAAEDREPAPGYAKKLDAYGIRIEATDLVRNDWLYFAALVYEHMTDHETRYDIRDALEDRGFRILLAGSDQRLTELPEYADDPEVAEAGGLGGNPGEYRIAVRTMHPHILVHELAHGIYHSAIQYQENDGSIEPDVVEAPPRPGTFTHDLHAAYEAAMEQGLWRGAYFEAHPDEYWAEGVSLWFRTLPTDQLRDELEFQLDPASDRLLESDPRAFLAGRDPALHRLVGSIFPASDWWPMEMQVMGPEEFPLDEGEGGGLIDLAIDLQDIAIENIDEAMEIMSEISFDIVREEGRRIAAEVFDELTGLLEDQRLRDHAERLIRSFEPGEDADDDTFEVEQPAGVPDFEVRALPEEGRLSVFRPEFDRYVDVFGITIVATPRTEERKVLHAANLLAEYLDNDEDGAIDDPAVHRALIDGGAFLVMFATEREAERSRIDQGRIERAGFRIGQGLYGEETIPDGPPHVRRAGRFDASLEEVLHLVSNGWRDAYPEDFGYEPGSRLTDAMDLARGGRFRRVPRNYPESAWYHYDDRTCDYECMAAEYLYWALTSLAGGQDYPGRAREIADEWECPTPELVRERDSAVHELLTDERFALPRRLPDGRYRPQGD